VASEDDRRRILAGLDDAQLEAVTTDDAPLLVLAGAGSGKTRVLARRIAWRAATADSFIPHVLALTFTRKAATELRQRLRALGLAQPVLAGTFHAVALNELRRRALDLRRPLPVVVDAKPRLLVVAATRVGLGTLGRAELLRCIDEIEWAKARHITPTDYQRAAEVEGRANNGQLSLTAQLYDAYEIEKRRRGVLDIDDLLPRLVEEIRSDVDFAASQRWRFRHFFVDELQDANPAQLALLDCWVDGRSDLFGVGDPNQAIYGWNGADPAAVTSFGARSGGASVINLEANYRSTPEIIAVASAVLTTHPLAIESPRPSGSLPTFAVYPDAETEAKAVADEVRRAHRTGHRWSEIALLARTNAQLGLLGEALQRGGIPVHANASKILTQPATRAAFGQLAAARDGVALREHLEDLAADRSLARPVGVPPSSANAALRELLVELGQRFLELEPAPTGQACVEFIRETLAAEGDPRAAEGVALLTFHRAKGLEWPVVFVTGLEDGLVPIAHARTAEQQDEERRLLYVALSRAEDALHCSWARQRGARGTRRPSPFLAALEECRDALSVRAENPSVARRALAESRAVLGKARHLAGR
jgi:DNA helicase-2/ATP-dependent DNA helicase PcrA